MKCVYLYAFVSALSPNEMERHKQSTIITSTVVVVLPS